MTRHAQKLTLTTLLITLKLITNESYEGEPRHQLEYKGTSFFNICKLFLTFFCTFFITFILNADIQQFKT